MLPVVGAPSGVLGVQREEAEGQGPGGVAKDKVSPGEASPGPLTISRKPHAAPSQPLKTAPSQLAHPPEPGGQVTLAEPGRRATEGAPESLWRSPDSPPGRSG